jgi:hypothetical protein
VAGLGLINTLVVSVAERRRELGVFRAIGGLRRQVRRMILLEAASISLIGLATGALAGIFNAYFLVRTAAIMIAGLTLPFHFPVSLVLITVPAVLIVGLLAAWWPAQWACACGWPKPSLANEFPRRSGGFTRFRAPLRPPKSGEPRFIGGTVMARWVNFAVKRG